MADHRAGSSGEAKAAALAEQLLRWKRRLAPPGSLRARAVRALAEPFLGHARTDRLRQSYLARPEPRATIATWDGAAPRGRVLPDRPGILVLKLDHIGDFVVALPALRMLRDSFASATITLVCGGWNADLATRLGWFDRVVAFDAFTPLQRGGNPVDADCITRFAALGLNGYDLAVDLRHEPDTRALLGRVGAAYRAGFQASEPPALDLAMPDCQDGGTPPLHAEVRLVSLAAAVSATFGRRAPGAAWDLLSQLSERPPGQPYAVLAPGGGSPVKRWPIERLVELARLMVARLGLDIVVIGGPADRDDGRRLAAALPSERVRDLTATLPLVDLPDLLRQASLFVGYDSGPTHLAASLGVATVCVFSGVSDPDVWQPLGETVTVIAGRTGCSPCRLVHARDCPNGVACLDVIPAQTVFEACERIVRATVPIPARGPRVPAP